MPDSFNAKFPDNLSPSHPPLYGFEAVNVIARALYIAPLGTTYLYSCMRGYYREYAGVTLACLGDGLWHAYDYNLLYGRTADPNSKGCYFYTLQFYTLLEALPPEATTCSL